VTALTSVSVRSWCSSYACCAAVRDRGRAPRTRAPVSRGPIQCLRWRAQSLPLHTRYIVRKRVSAKMSRSIPPRLYTYLVSLPTECASSGSCCWRWWQPPTAFRLASGRCLQLLLRSPPARPSSWRRRTRRLQSWRTCQPQRWRPVSPARGWSLWFAWPSSNALYAPAFSHAPPVRQAALVSSTAGPPDAAPYAVVAISLLKLGQVLLGEE
jgi:hypothetical protein